MPNVTLHAFETLWIQEGWLPLECRQSRPFTRLRYAVVTWEDLQSFANFQVFSVAWPNQDDHNTAQGSLRADAPDSVGIIIPPLIITHR